MDVDAFLDGGFEDLLHTSGLPLAAAATSQDATRPQKRSHKAVQAGKARKRDVQRQRGPSSSDGGHKATLAKGPAHGQQDAGVSDIKRETRAHKAQLDALKQADPDFYKYLQESDKALLMFSDDEESASEDEESASEDLVDDEDLQPSEISGDAAMEVVEGGRAPKPSGQLDSEQVQRCCRGAKENASLGAIQSVLHAYRAACHLGDNLSNDDASDLCIVSDAAFQHILLFTLREADSFLRRGLGLASVGCPSDAQLKTPRCRKGLNLVKSYLGNTLHLLTHLAEEHTSSFILRRARTSIGLLASFPTLQKKWTKLVLGLFGSAEARRVRVQALLWLREAAVTLGRDGLDDILKGAYRTYAAHARFVSATSLPHIAFMAAGVVELYGLDASASYEHMFGFVAQLAVLLRNALTVRTVEAYREVYAWKFVNCIEVWGRVLAAHLTRMPELRPLVYPVTQILLGSVRLVPSPRWFPVRLRLIRITVALASASAFFVPVSPLLLEMLSWSELGKPARGTGSSPDFALQLRLSKVSLKLPAVQQEVVEQVLELLGAALALSATNPGFPELAHLPMVALRRFIKASKVERFRSQAKLLLDAIESNAKFVGLHRDAADFAPRDVAAVSAFLGDADRSKLPLVLYATRLATKGTGRRAAALGTAPVSAGEEELADTADDGTDSDMDLLPQPKPGKKAKSSSDHARKKARLPAAMSDSAVSETDTPLDDLIEDYALSDEDA